MMNDDAFNFDSIVGYIYVYILIVWMISFD